MILETTYPINVNLDIKTRNNEIKDLNCQCKLQLGQNTNNLTLILFAEELGKLKEFIRNPRGIVCYKCKREFVFERDNLDILIVNNKIYGVTLICPNCKYEEDL